jgi:transposase-like protein
MKREEREKARELRRDGHSVKEICRMLGVAKSSVSIWVRDIELTDEQRLALKKHYPGYPGQHLGSRAVAAKYRELRRQYQEEGRVKAREGDALHLAGCMLYWGEGEKGRPFLSLANSDAAMLRFYTGFLRESLLIDDNEIVVRVSCYLGNGLIQKEIEDYWLSVLRLPRSCLRKTLINVKPRSSQQKGRKLKYGVCRVGVYRVQYVQHVLGAIQEYAGIEKLEWLM